jgi:hypothetical protein
MNLLTEIEKAATDSNIPLPDLLRRCKALAARLKHSDLANWIANELNGYADDAALPPYRVLRTIQAFGDFEGPFGMERRNAPLPISLLDARLRSQVDHQNLRNPIAELQAIVTSGPTLAMRWAPDVVGNVGNKFPTYENMFLVDAWSSIPTSFVSGILDTVRTRVLDFVLAIQAENPDAGNCPPNAPPPIPASTVTQHFNTTIIGGQAIVGTMGPSSIGDGNVASGERRQAAGIDDETVKSILAELRDKTNELEPEQKTEALDAVASVEAQLAKAKPSFDKIKQHLGLYASLVAAAAPAVDALTRVLAPIFGR